jgi:uncharacterized protein
MTSVLVRVGCFAFAVTLSGVLAQAKAQASKPSATTGASVAADGIRATSKKSHLVTLHVDQNDAAVMNLALNNAQNIVTHFKALGRPVKIEVVTYGPGLVMLRDDRSPVKQRIATLALEANNISFVACANTRDNMAKAEGAAVPLIAEARLVPSGVVHLMDLQARGYAYIKP